MDESTRTTDRRGAAGDPGEPRWLTVALASSGVHQVQSFIVEPAERPPVEVHPVWPPRRPRTGLR